MLLFLYRFTVLLYAGIIRTVSPFNAKAHKWVVGRRKTTLLEFREKRKLQEKWMWFHCASLGEYEDCCEVFRDLTQKMSGTRVLLTFSSPSGYEALKNSPDFDQVSYLPVDRPSKVNAFLDILQPSLVLFARSELWINYLSEIHKRRIPLFLISLKMDEKSGFLKWPAILLYRKAFSCFTHIFCQDTRTAALLNRRWGIRATSLTGNTRYNRIFSEFYVPRAYPEIAGFAAGHFTIIVGSYLPRDLKIIRRVIPPLLEMDCRFVLVPHEIGGSEIGQLTSAFPGLAIAYSEIQNLDSKHHILVIDHVGSLKHLYKYADLAIVGGGFNSIGIHNVIEPAIYGLVTLFGPNHRNYQEALDLIAMEAGFVFSGSEELLKLIRRQIQKSGTASDERQRIHDYVRQNTGDHEAIVSTILGTLQEKTA
jgi:3-deoxy-D-manno-octulosonic-acid transferase